MNVYPTMTSIILLAYPNGPHLLRPLPYFEHRFVQAAMTMWQVRLRAHVTMQGSTW